MINRTIQLEDISAMPAATIAGSTVNLSSLDNGLKADDRISQVSIFDDTNTAGVIDRIRLEVSSIVIKQDQSLRSLISELIGAGMAPATASAICPAAHLVFDNSDALDDTLPVGFIRSLLKLTYSTNAVGTVPYITQVFGAPNRSQPIVRKDARRPQRGPPPIKRNYGKANQTGRQKGGRKSKGGD